MVNQIPPSPPIHPQRIERLPAHPVPTRSSSEDSLDRADSQEALAGLWPRAWPPDLGQTPEPADPTRGWETSFGSQVLRRGGCAKVVIRMPPEAANRAQPARPTEVDRKPPAFAQATRPPALSDSRSLLGSEYRRAELEAATRQAYLTGNVSHLRAGLAACYQEDSAALPGLYGALLSEPDAPSVTLNYLLESLHDKALEQQVRCHARGLPAILASRPESLLPVLLRMEVSPRAFMRLIYPWVGAAVRSGDFSSIDAISYRLPQNLQKVVAALVRYLEDKLAGASHIQT